jgi:hypothetical protein
MRSASSAEPQESLTSSQSAPAPRPPPPFLCVRAAVAPAPAPFLPPRPVMCEVKQHVAVVWLCVCVLARARCRSKGLWQPGDCAWMPLCAHPHTPCDTHAHGTHATHLLRRQRACCGEALLQPHLYAGEHRERGQAGVWLKPTPVPKRRRAHATDGVQDRWCTRVKHACRPCARMGRHAGAVLLVQRAPFRLAHTNNTTATGTTTTTSTPQHVHTTAHFW